MHPEMPNPSLNKMIELSRIVNAINVLEPKISALSDAELKAKTAGFKEHCLKRSREYEQELQELAESMMAVAIPEEKEKLKKKVRDVRNKIFEEILPEAFAVVREASRRTIGLRHFDVQMLEG